ncbi:phosphate signaling complex protein PhoU [Thiorhodovibrio frisius]|uniref:Phosphate-specific transport system accessory protein PhoU n=1 Tax=Thiorhodovibrio frisius TaxID=631362 RepID=H8Z159_9GAMM|nr:phosphate signaling complex protein PhoU [Thiorhodovibrio frisius]EIC21374.1 phosphate transport system regulatory protein PhoU [Thiorhodovibrio frisius]WPL23960.1 Repressor protein PhoU [Thiorhodovibrio frisius]
MIESPRGRHIMRAFDQELARLRDLVLDMKTRVLEQTREALTSLLEPDINAAHLVLDREPGIDTLTLEADEEIFIVIAKRQPTAVDLRLVMAISKVINDLERGGDHAASMARSAIRLHESGYSPPSVPLSKSFEQLFAAGCQMLEQGVTALAEADLTPAIEVFELETAFYQQVRSTREDILDSPYAQQPRAMAELLTIPHSLKRLGNHGANIAEQAVYVIRGDDVRYRNRELLIDALRHANTGS